MMSISSDSSKVITAGAILEEFVQNLPAPGPTTGGVVRSEQQVPPAPTAGFDDSMVIGLLRDMEGNDETENPEDAEVSAVRPASPFAEGDGHESSDSENDPDLCAFERELQMS
ncbi:hypothetical protein N7508_009884 [Penicillium antarcticum]|uniref:uncharacterized protein n=1 Tax=Penicillium antarcticum TaxID=416450 RepID=UPI0023A64CC3|nr:uncharacterized protein N7508_009884 [Penicillium antarcticum]KAJ5295063.1 hypothetical protein N7508_009884 [Penicillium antarcticum]